MQRWDSRVLRLFVCVGLLLHVGCFTVDVGEPSDRRAVTIGFVPSTGAAWHAEQNIQGKRPLTGGKRFTDAVGMTAWAILTNLVFIGIPTVLNWVTEPFGEYEPPLWGRGLPSRFCKEALIGFCRTRNLQPRAEAPATMVAGGSPEGTY